MSVEDYPVSFSLEVNVGDVEREIRRLETVFYRTLALARRMGLPEPIEQQIAGIKRLIRFVNQLRLAYAALQVARMAAGDPVAWAMAGIAVAEVAVDSWVEVTSY